MPGARSVGILTASAAAMVPRAPRTTRVGQVVAAHWGVYEVSANSPIVFDWINSAHQLGAGASAFLGATARDLFGAYDVVWTTLGAVCVVASLLAVAIRGPRGARRGTAQ